MTALSGKSKLLPLFLAAIVFIFYFTGLSTSVGIRTKVGRRFRAKESLVVDLQTVSDIEGFPEKYKVDLGVRLLKYDFVLVTARESSNLWNKSALYFMGRYG